MMKKENNIEDKMKALSDEQRVAPPAFVWENIESNLDKEKKRRRPIIWLFLGVLVLGVGSIGVLQFNNNEGKEQTSIIEKGDLLVKHEGDKVEQKSEGDKDLEIENEILSESKEVEESPSLDQIESNVTKQNLSTSVSRDKRIINQNSKPKQLIEPQNILDEKGKEALRTEIYKLDEFIKPSSVPSVKNDEKEIFVEDSRSEVFGIAHLALLTNNIDLNIRKIKHHTVDCPKFGKSFDIDYFVEANGLLGSHQKRFGDQSTLSLLRSDTESSYLDYGANLSAGLYLNNNLYAMVGFDWYNAVDRFKQEREGLTKVVIDYDLETGSPIDTSFVTGTIANNGIVNYRSIDVPITLGYRVLSGSWSYGLELGAMINIGFKTSGKIVSETGLLSTISDESPVYKDNLGFGLKSSIVVGKYLRNGLSIQSRLTYKGYLHEANDETYILPTRFNFLRLEVGVRKEF